MDTGRVEVVRVGVTREEIGYDHETAGAEISAALATIVAGRGGGGGGGGAGGRAPYRLPLAKEHLAVELAGVPTAVANALRRTLLDELRGRCLTYGPGDFVREASTDPFMVDDDFTRTRIRLIRLRPQISDAVVKDLRFAIDAENTGDTVISVYAGDMVVTQGSFSEPLFNPLYEIASLQPGRTLRINNIRIAEGYGYQDAVFSVACLACTRPLDLPEHPRAETHTPGGCATQESGYTVSSSVANPRRHLITAFIPAVTAGSGGTALVLIEACAVIMQRLRYIKGVLEAARGRPGRGDGSSTHHSARAFFLVTPDDEDRTKGVLGVRGETHTIGNLLSRSVSELMPDIGFAAYTCIPHEKMMRLTVRHAVSDPSEIGAIVARAVDHAYAVFGKIQQGIRALT